jgi:hypothetical protein
MTIKNRIEKLEKNARPIEATPVMSDEERLARMKELALLIAKEAAAQGVTAEDDPRFALPLAIAQALK